MKTSYVPTKRDLLSDFNNLSNTENLRSKRGSHRDSTKPEDSIARLLYNETLNTPEKEFAPTPNKKTIGKATYTNNSFDTQERAFWKKCTSDSASFSSLDETPVKPENLFNQFTDNNETSHNTAIKIQNQITCCIIS